MASPQIEEGYFKLANDLGTAIGNADFRKAELRVVIEIAMQTFSYRKARGGIVNAAAMEVRSGTNRKSITRAVRSLEACGVIEALVDGSYRIVKDFTHWRVQGAGGGLVPRYTDAEIRDARHSVATYGTYSRRPPNTCNAQAGVGNQPVPEVTVLEPTSSRSDGSGTNQFQNGDFSPEDASYKARACGGASEELRREKREASRQGPPAPLPESKPAPPADPPELAEALARAVKAFGADTSHSVRNLCREIGTPAWVLWAIQRVEAKLRNGEAAGWGLVVKIARDWKADGGPPASARPDPGPQYPYAPPMTADEKAKKRAAEARQAERNRAKLLEPRRTLTVIPLPPEAFRPGWAGVSA